MPLNGRQACSNSRLHSEHYRSHVRAGGRQCRQADHDEGGNAGESGLAWFMMVDRPPRVRLCQAAREDAPRAKRDADQKQERRHPEHVVDTVLKG